MSDYGFKPYVSVAKRLAKAEREMSKLRKKGMNIQPIEIAKRKITHTFWGDAWCEHIEAFSDYDNRLPRGRTYVRNGSVCHLKIDQGCIEAIVSGSELYKVHIEISPLSVEKWDEIKNSCAGKIESLLDLLSGKLSDGVMQSVCDQRKGLFPLAEEIKLSCNCFDWATMCKHVAAVLYGVGARLDHSPEQLFKLRGVNHEELVVDAAANVFDATQNTGSSRRRINNNAVADVFGIDITEASSSSSADETKTLPKKVKTTSTATRKPTLKQPKYISGASLRKRRMQLNLSQKALAGRIGVSASTISIWENKGRHKLDLCEAVKVLIDRLWEDK